MKTKLLSLAATILFAASVNTISAQEVDWVNYSAVQVNGTWYKCSSNDAGWNIEYFNGKDLGKITSLVIGGQCYMHCVNDWKHEDWTMTMGYSIDGVDMTHTLSYKSYDNNYKTMCFESGGQNWNTETIDISGLIGGKHTLAVWFNKDDKWDSNNGANYVATFTIDKPIVLVNDKSNTNIIARNIGYTGDVQLNGLTLYKDTYWNTLCLPFSLTQTEIQTSPLAGAVINKLSSSTLEGTTLTLNFEEATAITAGIPYIIKWTSAADPVENPIFTGVKLSTSEAGLVEGDYEFVGCFEPTSIESEDYLYLGAENTLYYPESAVEIGAFRAYFTNSNSAGQAKAFVLNFDDETTSIKQINNSESATNSYFTIDGRRINDMPATPGLYILNGKKVVIK